MARTLGITPFDETPADQAARMLSTNARKIGLSVPPSFFDTDDARTARNTAEMASYIADLAELTRQNLELNVQAQANAIDTERFTRRMAVGSLWVSIASLVAAFASLAVSLTVGS